MKIFVIDDDPMMLESIKDFLEKEYPGDEADVFSSGEVALRHIYKKPDIIILDYYLDSNRREAKNGIEILKQIKIVLPDVPVIFLTGQESPVVAADTIKSGAYDYIIKGENAFTRLQILLKKLHGYGQLKSKVAIQKTMNIILVILLAVLVISLVMMRMG